ncbi:MAG TPA: phosphatase PAP2 family protein [Tepidisphaeraceae bacterium]|jgi:membrane-associated phospholipid phosphatase
MNLLLLIALAAGCAILFVLERLGVPTTLDLQFKGDIKRESRWLAQYGQSVCTPVAALLVWQLDAGHGWQRPVVIVAAVLATSIMCAILKRLLGRVRPGREQAGKFLGPSFEHANYRESFPSSHSACAVALTTALVYYYPQAAATLWALAIICALLRYILDAHWPSDVLGGCALGYAIAHLVVVKLPGVLAIYAGSRVR